MGKTIYITDKDALDVDRVIVSSTGMEYKILYSCDEIDQYETRLKADLVAMLTEIQLEIEEVKTQSGFDKSWDGAVNECSKVIQQKINSLKEKNNYR